MDGKNGQLILMMMVDGDVIDIDQLNKKKNHFGIQ
jgi:hypothetical protein